MQIIKIPSAEELRSDFDAVQNAVSEASRLTGRAVALALRCGRSFRSVRECAAKGEDYREIIRRAIPEIPDVTIEKWIRTEERSGDLLSNPAALKQAFLSIGLLPESEPGEASDRENKPSWNYVTHLGRAERAIREQVRDFSALNHFERETLKKRLAPLVEIYEALNR